LTGSLLFVKLDSFLPFLFILPFAAYQIYCDASRQSRQLLPELTGAIAISSSAAVIALADNWTFGAAIALWAIFAARLIPSIIYVRNRLRLEKGKEFSQALPVFAHIVALSFGLSPYRKKVKAMKIGVWEVIYGALTAFSVVIGYYLKI
jgi:hypothetical protein